MRAEKKYKRGKNKREDDSLKGVEWIMYLNPGLWQVDLQSHLLPHEDVRISTR
jgi:hypothetical protein